MKKSIFACCMILFAAFALTFVSCGGDTSTQTKENTEVKEATETITSQPKDDASTSTETGTEAEGEVDKTGPEYTAHWICPMHCKGSGSEKAGKCPACGMAYVENPDHHH